MQKPEPESRSRQPGGAAVWTAGRRAGFTLLELMAAMVILTIAMMISFQAFSGTIRAWRRGTEVIDGIKQGEYAMTQLTAALNSTIYFYNAQKNYAFMMVRDTVEGLPADSISFVTSSSAFMPEESPFKRGPHRIELFIDYDETGEPALFSYTLPAVTDMAAEEMLYETEPYLISRAVQGLEVLLWNAEDEEWSDEDWTEDNAIPERIRLTLYVASEEKSEPPILFTRVIDIPTAQSLSVKLKSPTTYSLTVSDEQER